MKKRYLSALHYFIGFSIAYIILFFARGLNPFLLYTFITIWVTVAITIYVVSVNDKPGVIPWKNIPYGVPFTLIDCVTIKIKKGYEREPEYYKKGEFWYHIKIGLVHCTVKRSNKLTFQNGTTVEKGSDGQLIISPKKDDLEEFVPKGLKGLIDVL